MNKYPWLLELLVGLLGAALVAPLGAMLGRGIAGNENMADLAGALTGLFIGLPLGIGLGMGLAARWLGEKRPFLPLIGAFAGLILVMLLAEPTRLNQNTNLLFPVVVVASLLGAFAALHWGQKRP
ncbi:MAG: hypothetical protein R3C62_02490 [Chloroflexota bacterium]